MMPPTPPWLLSALTPLVLPLIAPPLVAQGDEPIAPPSIVLILADDLGYGDVSALATDSALATPNIDRLAEEGALFSDAHSPSAVCTPTRYGLLTGRYAWRTRLKSGVLGGYSKPLLEPERSTVASRLAAAGYRTVMVGKWHLGMELPLLDDAGGETERWPGDPGVDFEGTITDGPLQHGFESCLAVTASLDMPPYVYVRDDRFVTAEVVAQAGIPFPHFVRQGPRAAELSFDHVLDDLISEAERTIAATAKDGRPLFLYLPLTAPHKPTWPHPYMRGTSSLGEYGDLVTEVDRGVGRVTAALEEAGIRDNTLMIVTSDNGSYMYAYGADEEDHVDLATRHGFRRDRHRANGPWRGTKADIWEAGHRVPLLACWPAGLEAGRRVSSTVCLTDVYATLVELLGQQLDEQEAEDSFSLLPLLQGGGSFVRAPVVHHSVNGTFAIREGRWKLVLSNGSGGREKPRGEPFGEPWQLFDLEEDPAEATDLALEHPEVVERLGQTLEELRSAGRSR